ncbi:unnamed protein product [Pleuronectes platessa]|uniref:Uncharacterized protein n=1 Tax=Pleuronectes platessa TaxID=8262 RepID=A0A9N7VTL1_PLEPL|nr:unnamed protein product [Pleuronectes platessa]
MPQVDMLLSLLLLFIGVCVHGQDPASKVVSDRYAVNWNRTNPNLSPAPRCSVPLGLKTDTKRRPRPNIDRVSGPQPAPSARADGLKGGHCSARTQRPIAVS